MQIKKEYRLPDGTKVSVTVAGKDVREEDFPVLRESTASATASALCDMAEILKTSQPEDRTMSDDLKPCPEIHMGVSGLRQMCSTTLKMLDKTIILHERAEPIAVLIPYAAYMKWQDKHDDLLETLAAWNRRPSQPEEPK